MDWVVGLYTRANRKTLSFTGRLRMSAERYWHASTLDFATFPARRDFVILSELVRLALACRSLAGCAP